MGFFDRISRKKNIGEILASAQEASERGGGLRKSLGVYDLTALGIAAIIGTGVLSTIGRAIYGGGPAVIWLYVFTALACSFSALCYAQFASSIPVSGSAYTYSYVAFGELVAWLVGWNLLIEYGIGNIAVAVAWSDYFTGLVNGLDIFGWRPRIPDWMTLDYLSAARAAAATDPALAPPEALNAWNSAPRLGGLRIIADVPALAMTLLVTGLVYVGIRESKIAGNIMVLLKLAIVLAVIAVGFFYVQPDNWTPFAPNGVSGVLGGMASVFFAYIGFDALSTMAEECREPQRDLPRSMFWSLGICTVLYVVVVLVLTGMSSYKNFASEDPVTHALHVKGDPLAYVFEACGLPVFSGIIAFSAVIAIAGVFMVFQLGQPRIWMIMSRDGLLWKKFSEIHPRYRTPAFATIMTGLIVAIPALFLNLTEVTDLSSMGTLLAFAMVCAGVLVMDANGSSAKARFRIWYLNSRYWLPATLAALWLLIWLLGPDSFWELVYCDAAAGCPDKYPFYAFLVVLPAMSIWAVVRQWSFIPAMGLLCNLFMMSQLGWTNWKRFLIWILLGLVIYFAYGYRHSKLAR